MKCLKRFGPTGQFPLSPGLFARAMINFSRSYREQFGGEGGVRGTSGMKHRQNPKTTAHARELRDRQTEAESLLWYVLRGRRLCGLKFRRQYPIKPYIADFACVEKRLVIEIDGGYHDYVEEKDKQRQEKIEALGWTVIRFPNEEVLDDVDAIAIAIAKLVGLEPTFRAKGFL